MVNQQWVLAERPESYPQPSHFRMVRGDIPKLQSGKALVKTLYLGVAPVMLRYMRNDTEFEAPLEIGDLMMGRGVAQVLESDCPELPEGSIVQARLGWQEYALIDNAQRPTPFLLEHHDLPYSHGLSSLGPTGFTALIGLREIGALKYDDKILVSGAAGGVGSQVAQIAKALGASRVVGIAGGAEKCRLLVEQLGYDAAIDYKSSDLAEALQHHFPEGIDLFYDNVGGPVLDEVLARIRRRARIVICGSISEYLLPAEAQHRFKNLQQLGRQDARMEAFFVFDYGDQYSAYANELASWIRAGLLQPKEDISRGIESLPGALMDLYTGANIGARMVHVADPVSGV